MKSSHPLACAAALMASGLLSSCQPGDEAEADPIVTEVAVQVAKVVRADLHATVTAYGIVEPAPARDGEAGGGVQLSTPVAGIVRSVEFSEGQQIKAGDVILKLDDRAQLASVDKARHIVTFAEALVARQEKLEAVNGTSEKAIESAREQLTESKADLIIAEAQLALVQLSSPIDGTVVRVNVQAGQGVDVNTLAASIVDLDRLVVTVKLSATEAGIIQRGQAASVFIDQAIEHATTGSVSFISPSIDAGTGLALARIDLPRDSRLRPGQFVRALIVTGESKGSLAVPVEAVYTDQDGTSTLSIVDAQGLATRTEVSIGLREGNLVEIKGDGIAEGTVVATTGSYALPESTRVRILNGAAEGEKSP